MHCSLVVQTPVGGTDSFQTQSFCLLQRATRRKQRQWFALVEELVENQGRAVVTVKAILSNSKLAPANFFGGVFK
ncbi:MAG: hypothetical protein QW343_01645 [Candidatus Norongarragalinales archaeon]